MPDEDLDEAVNQYGAYLDERSLQDGIWTLASTKDTVLFLQIREAGVLLSDYLGNENKVFYGHISGCDDAFVISADKRDRILRTQPQSAMFIHPLLRGENIRRYHIAFQNYYLIAIPKGYTQLTFGSNLNKETAWQKFSQDHPALAEHLSQHQEAASGRVSSTHGNYWWECMRRETYLRTFNLPKIIFPTIAGDSRFTFDNYGYYLKHKGSFIPSEDLFLLGILNSKTIHFYFKHTTTALGGAGENEAGGLEWHIGPVSRIPIPPAASTDPRRRAIERCVKEALQLAPQEAAALPGSREQQVLRRRLDQLDAEIDEVVCALYGLTEAQKARVLGG